VKADTTGFEPGTTLRLKYFSDATKRNWKRRLVLNICAKCADAID
jgi:hypothetical protein